MEFRLYLDPREVWAQSLPVGGLLARLVRARSESALRVTAYRVIIAGYKKAIQTTTNAKIINKVIILDIS